MTIVAGRMTEKLAYYSAASTADSSGRLIKAYTLITTFLAEPIKRRLYDLHIDQQDRYVTLSQYRTYYRSTIDLTGRIVITSLNYDIIDIEKVLLDEMIITVRRSV